MNKDRSDFIELILSAFKAEALKKLVFSRPISADAEKISARLCSHRGRRILALEYSLTGNTVSQKNVAEDDIFDTVSPLFDAYRQVNLITALGDAERKISKSGKEVFLGVSALRSRLSGERPRFESAIEALDNRKNYILDGDESFLIKLGISDKNGRVHDKRQGKFRQINRFLEHIEDIYGLLPKDGEINIYDLCCGKSYLSFAVYYFLTEIKGRRVRLLGMDLKRDVILWCESLARELGFVGMRFVCDDVTNTPKDEAVDMVISLHACDIATDIVLNRAIELRAKIILSTPCCHKYLNDKISSELLTFVTDYPHLRNKLCEAITDSLRLKRLKASGYKVSALELVDPENTPKNTLIRAILDGRAAEAHLKKELCEYNEILKLLLGEKSKDYLSEIKT